MDMTAEDVLARILDPAAFDSDSALSDVDRSARQATANATAARLFSAGYRRDRGWWGCDCESCLNCTGRCGRCGRRDPVEGGDLCGPCESALAAEVAPPATLVAVVPSEPNEWYSDEALRKQAEGDALIARGEPIPLDVMCGMFAPRVRATGDDLCANCDQDARQEVGGREHHGKRWCQLCLGRGRHEQVAL